jgi:hypothetical protein
MSFKVIELKGTEAYTQWMETNGDKIEIIAERWRTRRGASGSDQKNDKTYTVTYREKQRAAALLDRCRKQTLPPRNRAL